ncbi:MAG: superoxide dismutase family protein [Pseudomonadota bacterium]|nr:superoxide dismutase family protein [Pseudomonadota bacterium]
MKLLPVIAASMALAGCAMVDRPEPRRSSVIAQTAATATLRTAAGRDYASASATQVADSIRIRIEALGMPRGTYGVHIHSAGRCDAPDFATAGPHWNPTGQQHGKNNPAGMHKGDLPNLLVGTDGRGSWEINVPGSRLSGGRMPMLDADGAAIVIHEQADDYQTDPSGNSGARIACGVFG